LSNVCTYYSDDGLRSSWIDHLTFSQTTDDLVQSVDILPQFISFDHKPTLVTFDSRINHLRDNVPVIEQTYDTRWSRADVVLVLLLQYKQALNNALSYVDVPVSLHCLSTTDHNNPLFIHD